VPVSMIGVMRDVTGQHASREPLEHKACASVRSRVNSGAVNFGRTHRR
jgi:hypothetical protein